jgi:hypothetical protein
VTAEQLIDVSLYFAKHCDWTSSRWISRLTSRLGQMRPGPVLNCCRIDRESAGRGRACSCLPVTRSTVARASRCDRKKCRQTGQTRTDAAKMGKNDVGVLDLRYSMIYSDFRQTNAFRNQAVAPANRPNAARPGQGGANPLASFRRWFQWK